MTRFVLVGIPNPEVFRSEIGGVPVFAIDGQRPFRAFLQFRVGVFDEVMANRGITHLVEHLALHPLRHTEITHNGAVEPRLTSIWGQGKPDDVGVFLRDACQSIHDLDFGRLQVESEVLQREGAMRSSVYADHLLWSYFGPFGPGLVGAREAGLGWLTPDELESWARRFFTAQNAALVIIGEVPDDWELELPRGEKIPYELPRRRRPTPTSPTLFDTQGYGVTWGALVRAPKAEGNAELVLALQVLTRRLQDHFRHEQGATYDVSESMLRLDHDHMFVTHGFDVDPEKSRETAFGHSRVIQDYLTDGPSRDELDRVNRWQQRMWDDHPDDTAQALLFSLAEDHLQDWSTEISFDEWNEMCAAVTPEEAKDRFADAYSQSLTVADLPEGEMTPLASLFPTEARPLPGVQFETRFRHRGRGPLLRVGSEGISMGGSDGWVNSTPDEVALVSFRGDELNIEAAHSSMTLQTSHYMSSLSFWLRRVVLWPAGVLLTVALVIAGLNLGNALFLLTALATPFAVLALARDPLPGEIVDRSLSIEDAVRKYLPEELVRPRR